jgi:palmitoyl-protein thioesterase
VHSQGGLVARYFIERYNSPPVHNYIPLGSPQRGVDGIPSDIDENHPWVKEAEKYASKILYTKAFQEWISFAGYWNDSCHHEDYLEYCSFLPYLNKENICKLHNMVLVQSTKEYIVEPAISCHFGFYKQNSMTETESLFESDMYKNDTLGLKTLYETNRLHFREAHCLHSDFQSDEQNFTANVLPFLRLDRQEQSVIQSEPSEEQTQL